MRVTTAFSRLLRLPGVWVRRVRFEPDRVVVCRGRVAPPAAGLPRVWVLDAVSEGQAAGGLGLAALGSRDLAARGPLPPSTAVVPGARGADRERPVRPARVGVHTRLRMPRCVAGDAHRQVDDQADAADRLGHGRASTRSASTRSAGSANTSTSHSWSTITAARWCGDAKGPAKPPRTSSFQSSTRRPPMTHPSMPSSRARRASRRSWSRSARARPSPPVTASRARGSSPAWRSSPRCSRAPGGCKRSRWTWVPATPSRSASTLPRRSCASTPTTSCSSPTRRSTKSAAPTGTSSARSATRTPPSASRTPAGRCSRNPTSSPTSRPPHSPGSRPPAVRSGARTRSRRPSAASSNPASRSRTSRC